ncbi:phosphoribosyltransferase domain-containing protein [Tenacibaculum pacificus]|uniref:phosphoribosyltransferase domain-containing protein n=1 Tax=Tenacibaculum pacificus TaxID=3018314 RepID=UPI0022F3B104|nr:phosphoribosyltransferase domain-containing protein [Tenacibaculum pacificus]WBX74632.1 phosphoribosyltransferase domain-containing protein [Tenacibaculum pacificus]
MNVSDSIILNNLQVEQKIRRIAFQIYESNSNEKEIVIAGIANNGYLFAEKIHKVLLEISPLKIELCKVFIDKKKPRKPITTSLTIPEYENKSLVLIDDVLSSGTTLIYAIKHFLDVPLKRFKTAVLVNRNHKKYPVKADFKGISLSTSTKEHVVVEFDNDETVVYLT